jgi:uncharacterized oxidoreductase
MKLKGRTILITGGSAGIGLAFALKFIELGNEVIVTGRRQDVLDKIKTKHAKIHTIQSDVADPAQIAALVARVKAEFPKLDVLMNNAGIMLYKNVQARREHGRHPPQYPSVASAGGNEPVSSPPAADLAGLMAEMNINVAGVIGMTSSFIDILTANKGAVINVSSGLALYRCPPRPSTAPPNRPFTPIPSRCGSNWRKPA